MRLDFRLALYNWRMEQGISQTTAAERLGVSLAAINRWEEGKAYPKKYLLAKIAPQIGWNPDEAEAPTPDRVEDAPPLEEPAAQPVLTFTERMKARDRERVSKAYLDCTCEMVAAREHTETAKPANGHMVEKLIRLAGFLEGLQVPIFKEYGLSLQPHIDTLNEVIEEVKNLDQD